MTDQMKGTLATCVGVFLFGFASTILKLFYKNFPELRFEDVAWMRMALASALYFAIALLRRPGSLLISAKDFFYFAVFGCAVFVVQFFLMYSISIIHVGLASFTQSSATILICIYSVLVLKERLDKNKILGLFFGLAGLFVIFCGPGVLTGGSLLAWGLLAALASAAGKAFYILYGKRGANLYFRPTMMAYGLLSGSVIAFFCASPGGMLKAHAGNPAFWGYLLLLTGFGTVCSFLLYLYGVARLPATSVAILNVVEPVSGALTAFLILGEQITPRQGMGSFLIALGIVALNIEFKLKKGKTAEEILLAEENIPDGGREIIKIEGK